MPFPKTLDHTPDLGKARIGPEMIERLCELIDELPEVNIKRGIVTRQSSRLVRIRIMMNRHSFSAPFPFARLIRSGRHGVFSGFLRITIHDAASLRSANLPRW
jgi:hypothetical protein